ncbi:mixed lineage kinase domain-like protein isoform X2 [Zootoca vivipara]|uniref:mixed lineage kinase domain-like protein isoform X2 n=1 Tax=Zootoca vivipara TaxID=8524 RepID=UPI0015929B19|nr:mixed lineage kinase domain-like protein isoform X2 [Zootoca vivipara]
MDTIQAILNVSVTIYNQCEKMTECSKHRKRLVERIETLVRQVKRIRQACTPTRFSSDLGLMLKRTLNVLEEAQTELREYGDLSQLQRYLKAHKMLKNFERMNMDISDVGHDLMRQLEIEKLLDDRQDLIKFKKPLVAQEGRQDLVEDYVSLQEMNKVQDAAAFMGITEIPKSQITNVTTLMECESYTLCSGKYNYCSVAIKVFKNPLTENKPQDVRSIFRTEIKTMKKFESPYIVRLYGMCIDESGFPPVYSIITEYCEKGTLRQVLKKEPDLSWKIRLEMATGAAIGLYRLHQTGDKPQVHYCINSTRFLVAEGYHVKLSGFELSQTVSSIRRKPKEKPKKEVSASAYICPEGLRSVEHQYNLASEIYSSSSRIGSLMRTPRAGG